MMKKETRISVCTRHNNNVKTLRARRIKKITNGVVFMQCSDSETSETEAGLKLPKELRRFRFRFRIQRASTLTHAMDGVSRHRQWADGLAGGTGARSTSSTSCCCFRIPPGAQLHILMLMKKKIDSTSSLLHIAWKPRWLLLLQRRRLRQ